MSKGATCVLCTSGCFAACLVRDGGKRMSPLGIAHPRCTFSPAHASGAGRRRSPAAAWYPSHKASGSRSCEDDAPSEGVGRESKLPFSRHGVDWLGAPGEEGGDAAMGTDPGAFGSCLLLQGVCLRVGAGRSGASASQQEPSLCARTQRLRISKRHSVTSCW